MYRILKHQLSQTVMRALEPYLVFLNSVLHGNPSLVRDFIELYRYFIDDFLIKRAHRYQYA